MQNFLSLWLNAGAQITHGGQVQSSSLATELLALHLNNNNYNSNHLDTTNSRKTNATRFRYHIQMFDDKSILKIL